MLIIHSFVNNLAINVCSILASAEPRVPEKENEPTSDVELINHETEAKDIDDRAALLEAETAKKRNTENKELNDRISNLQLENRLLKTEISSLNEELAGALRTTKQIQDGHY